jgi:triosephosphate isomerase
MAGTGWKMNHRIAETRSYAEALLRRLPSGGDAPLDLFVLPPFTALATAAEAFAGSPVQTGGQNMHWAPAGAWTGEISAAMLVEAGCRYVELAHAERLQHFNETYAQVKLKVNAALANNLRPILCLGETADDRTAGRADQVIAGQLATALDDVGAAALARVVLAYEPRWAIGAAAAASPDYVELRHRHLRAAVAARWGEGAARGVRIIYGGSVSAANGPRLIRQPNVDGLFAGRAAWTPDGFAAIIEVVAAAVPAKEHSP